MALYFDKFTGICQPVLHECKLVFLRIICDHDLFVEMPGRDPSERLVYVLWSKHNIDDHKILRIGAVFEFCLAFLFRNYLASVLMQEVFMTWDHEDLNQRAKVFE